MPLPLATTFSRTKVVAACRRLRVQLRYRAKPTSRCRNIDRLPFRYTGHKYPFSCSSRQLSWRLGSGSFPGDWRNGSFPGDWGCGAVPGGDLEEMYDMDEVEFEAMPVRASFQPLTQLGQDLASHSLGPVCHERLARAGSAVVFGGGSTSPAALSFGRTWDSSPTELVSPVDLQETSRAHRTQRKGFWRSGRPDEPDIPRTKTDQVGFDTRSSRKRICQG
jgi:hypothetical protein